jgi:hypothetical protein
MKKSKINNCLFNHDNCTKIASSREHIIHNSRRKFIRDNGGDFGNEKARFKGITCANCNEYLGRYEEKYNSNLAISTLWKVIAGNINNVFGNNHWGLTQNTSKESLYYYLEILKNAFNERQVFPENMLGYKLTYFGTTNNKGEVSMSILKFSEGIIIFPTTIKIKNENTGYIVNKLIDILIYHTHDYNEFNMLFFLPLIPIELELGLNFSDVKINISHKGFGEIADELFENENTKIELNKIYCT